MKHLHNILYCLLFLAGFTSCVTDTIYDDSCHETGGANAKNVQVMFSLSIPGQQLPPATRTITNDAAINSLYLLVFEDDVLSAKKDITDKYKNANFQQFYVAVKESKKKVDMSVVANTDVSGIAEGNSKADVLKALTFTGANNLSVIPMYGETETFSDGLNRDLTYDVSVNLVRSLAKIEVQYNSTQTKREFVFTSIEVVNTNANGYVAPNQGSLDQDPVSGITMTPTILSGEPVRQEIASVYVAETPNNVSNKISVLIRGSYEGIDGWYRLDLIKSGESEEITQLVRNYKYVFALQNVNYPGHTSRAEALEGNSDNEAFEATVMTLGADEVDILDITTDDQFFLGVNSSLLQLEDNGNICFTKLKVLTNNPTGWSIVDAPAGVTFNPGLTGGQIAPGENRKVSTLWIYINKSMINTDFNFYVISGKIRKTITVKMPKAE